MTGFNQIKFILKLRSCSWQLIESHVPLILSNCKIYLSKGVNILLRQPVCQRQVSLNCLPSMHIVIDNSVMWSIHWSPHAKTDILTSTMWWVLNKLSFKRNLSSFSMCTYIHSGTSLLCRSSIFFAIKNNTLMTHRCSIRISKYLNNLFATMVNFNADNLCPWKVCVKISLDARFRFW